MDQNDDFLDSYYKYKSKLFIKILIYLVCQTVYPIGPMALLVTKNTMYPIHLIYKHKYSFLPPFYMNSPPPPPLSPQTYTPLHIHQNRRSIFRLPTSHTITIFIFRLDHIRPERNISGQLINGFNF